jgi:hypothetical protein
LQYTLPLGVQRGARTKLRLFGWNIGPNCAREFEFDGSDLPSDQQQAVLHIPGFENLLTLPIGSGPEIPAPPNAPGDQIRPPFAVTACLSKPDEIDRFTFLAKKGERLLFQVQANSFGFPLYPWLRVEDVDGKELEKPNNNNINNDPELKWAAPADGVFVAAVGNVLHRGGPDCLYRLEVQRAAPSVKAIVSKNAFTIEPGKTNEIKISVTQLNGFQSKLTILAKGLPAGITAEPVDVTDKGGETTLKLAAAADATPFSAPIQMRVSAAELSREYPVIAELTDPSSENSFTKLVIESTDQLWLTVLAAKPKEQ